MNIALLVPEKGPLEMSKEEFRAHIDDRRAQTRRAYLEVAITWRNASGEYRFSQVERREARRFMRKYALIWRGIGGGKNA